MKTMMTAAWLMAATATAAADAPRDMAQVFGSREMAWNVGLSPDASKIVYLGPMAGNGVGVVVADLKSGKTKVVLASTNVMRPYYCGWKSENRLICMLEGIDSVEGDLVGFSRILAFDADGSNGKPLGQRSNYRTITLNQSSGSILNWLPDDPDNVLMQIDVGEESMLGTVIRPPSPGISAQRINVRTGTRAAIVEPGNRVVRDLDTDKTGAVRFRVTMTDTPDGYVRDFATYLIRPQGSTAWKTIGSGRVSDGSAPSFDGFDETGQYIYQLKNLDGRNALYKLATDGSGRSELVFAHPVVDVDGVLRIGKYRRPVAARYTVDSTAYEFFDPELVKLSKSLAKALPGQTTIDILDESWDGNAKLVFAGSDNKPGRYYLFNKTTRELNELLDQRPGLKDVPLATVTAIKYPAHDGTMVPAYLTLPPGSSGKGLPAIIMPHGGPSSRDELGFDWLAQFWASQGYAVLQPNFRGSSGYGEAWYSNNGFKSWPIAIGDINDGARWLAAQGTADPKRTAIFGWSYGGYAALLGAEVDPTLYKAVVAVAPVTDLGELKSRARRFNNYQLVANFIGEGTHVAAGSPARNAEKMVAPVMLFHGDKDLNVNINQSRIMQSALKGTGKRSELITYPGLDHQLDDAKARADMLSRSAAFIAAALPK